MPPTHCPRVIRLTCATLLCLSMPALWAQTAGPSRTASAPAAAAAPSQEGVGSTLELRGRTAEDRAFDLQSARGKPTLVMYWNVACLVCKTKMPDLRKLADAGAINVITVATDRDGKDLAAYMKVLSATGASSKLVQVWTGAPGYKDSLASTPQRMPTTLLLDAKGTVRERIEGRFDDAALSRVGALK